MTVSSSHPRRASDDPRMGAPTHATFRIGPREIARGHPAYVIAEAGVNHDGDPGLARDLVRAAADARADAVKFQVFSADRLATRDAPMAAYQQTPGGPQSQYEMLKRLELSREAFAELADAAKQHNIDFLATPFSPEDVAFLDSLGVVAIKIASPNIVNTPLLEAAARTRRPVIASTGAAELEEVAEAVRLFDRCGKGSAGTLPGATGPDAASGLPVPSTATASTSASGATGCLQPVSSAGTARAVEPPVAPGPAPLALLHCVSGYPTPENEANLAAIGTLRRAFGCVVGFSDHTESIEMGGCAVLAGARIIEKHLTLDRNRSGPDHRFSLEPDMMREYVKNIREAERYLGDGAISPTPRQREVRELSRTSVVAVCDIAAGQLLLRNMLTVKRPGGGIAPAELDALVGCLAREDIPADAPLRWDALEAPLNPGCFRRRTPS